MAEDLCLGEHASVFAAAFCSASSSGGEKKLGIKTKQHPKNHRRNKESIFHF